MSEWSMFHKRGLTSLGDIQQYIDKLEQRLADAEAKYNVLEQNTCGCRWDGETQVRFCEFHFEQTEEVDASGRAWAERATIAEQRLAAVEAKIPGWIPVSERLPKQNGDYLAKSRVNPRPQGGE